MFERMIRRPLIEFRRWGPRLGLAALIAAGLAAAPAGAIEIEFLRPGDPRIEPPATVWDLSPRPVPLWIEALSAPEADVRREAALTIVLAHRLGVEKIETAIPALRKAVDDPRQHPVVVAAVARALVELDAREAASSLAARAEQGVLELAQVVEPALARWDHRPIRTRWLERLVDPQAHPGRRLLAIEGLAAVGEVSAAPRLKVFAAAPREDPGLRLAAARALGAVQPTGLEDLAAGLASRAGKEGMLDRLVAASLLRRHASEQGFQLLAELALDSEPAVAAAALERLLEHDFRLVLPLADRLAGSSDAKVRHAAAKAWIAERSPEAIGHLGPVLDDPHPAVRIDVREALLEMAAEPPLLDPVLQATKAMLAGGQWRGLEQAVMIMTSLDRDETAPRIVELLDFERPEVYVAAAWALRRLAVEETRPAILDKAERLYAIQAAARATPDENTQFQHLAEAVRVFQADEALPLLRKYIPKSIAIDPDARAAAIWTIGHLLAGRPEADLVEQMSARIADVASMPPEFQPVRIACAVSLGRMKAEAALPTLRKFDGGGVIYGGAEYACAWAIHQIAGEPHPVFTDRGPFRRSWFLEPVE
jgi:hypothetical protein